MTVATRWNTLVVKVSGRMCSNAFKKASLQLNNFGLKHFLLLLKSFITKALEYIAVLKFENNLSALLHIF